MEEQKFDAARRDFIKMTAMLAAIGVTGMTGLVENVFAKGVRPTINGVTRISGEVRINGSAPYMGSTVSPGDTVTTGKDSSATVVIQNSAFLIHEKSHIEFSGDGGQGRGDKLKGFRVKSGRILSVFEQGEYRVVTPTAVAGVRGTGLYVECRNEYTYICLCYGTLELEATAYPGSRELLTAKHHEKPRYIMAGAAGTPFLVAHMLNHTDEELTMLESLVGRTPPFGKSVYE